MGDVGSRVRISDVVRISDGYADFLSVGIRISYRWVPSNRVGAFILRSEDRTTIRSWAQTTDQGQPNPGGKTRLAGVRGRRGKRGTRKARNPRADWSRAARITRIRACPLDSNADNADPRIYAARMRADRRGSRRGLGVGYGVVPNADCALG